MLDIQALRNDLDGVVAQLKKRGFDFDAAKFAALEQRTQNRADAHAGFAG